MMMMMMVLMVVVTTVRLLFNGFPVHSDAPFKARLFYWLNSSANDVQEPTAKKHPTPPPFK